MDERGLGLEYNDDHAVKVGHKFTLKTKARVEREQGPGREAEQREEVFDRGRLPGPAGRRDGYEADPDADRGARPSRQPPQFWDVRTGEPVTAGYRQPGQQFQGQGRGGQAGGKGGGRGRNRNRNRNRRRGGRDQAGQERPPGGSDGREQPPAQQAAIEAARVRDQERLARQPLEEIPWYVRARMERRGSLAPLAER